MFRFLVPTMAILAVSLSACAGPGPTFDLERSPERSAAVVDARLDIQSASALTLAPGEMADIEVLYRESGVPTAGVPLRFALEGVAHDSAILDLQVVTDADGRVRTLVAAGSVAAVFRVRVSARGATAYVNVSVSDEGFGDLRVETRYAGARLGAGPRLISIHPGARCQDILDGIGQAPARQGVLLDPEAEAITFETLPAGVEYAVRATIRAGEDLVLASACQQGIALPTDEEVAVTLVLLDVPLDSDGAYQMTLTLETDLVASGLAAALGNVASLPGADAATLLDAVALRLADNEERALAFARIRNSEAYDNGLAARLVEDGLGPSVAVASLAALIEARLETVVLAGPWNAGGVADGEVESTWSIDALSVVTHLEDPDGVELVLDAELDSVVVNPLVRASTAPNGAVELAILGLELPLGTLARLALDAEAQALDLDGARELLDGRSGCDALVDWGRGNVELRAVCNADCLADACEATLDAVWADALTELEAVDERRNLVRVGGQLTGRDPNADLISDRLEAEPEAMSAQWTAVGSSAFDGDELPARVVAERLGDPD